MQYQLGSLKLALLTTTSLVSFLFINELPTQAATFSNSESFLKIDGFNIEPQNPNSDSDRISVAFTGTEDSIADANGDGTLAFIIDGSETSLELDFTSNSSGNGTDYFSLGQSSSITNSTFFLDSNDTLDFDFTVSLSLSNTVDSELDGSINTFSGVSFALFDNISDRLLGDFRAIGNIDTNLANEINDDTIFAESNLNFAIDFFDEEQLFGGNREFASIDIIGNIQQTVTVPTQVRLEANSFNISCTQATQTSNPCIRTVVSESNNIVGLICLFLGIFFSHQTRNKKLTITTDKVLK